MSRRTARLRLSVVVLEGDQTGQELLEQSLRVLDPELLGLELELGTSTCRSRIGARRRNQVVIDAAARDAATPASA